ncbi:MAG TPA: PIN domain-containing protein [Acidobacteriaceae bacterium]
MILADTSVWADHFHRPDPLLIRLLQSRKILMHQVVMGELAIGNLPHRSDSLGILGQLPLAAVPRHDEVMHLIEDWQLFGCGLGFIDAHLLASVLLTSGAQLWTRDKSLRRLARQLSLAANLA